MPQQIARMQQLFPQLRLAAWRCGRARWIGELRPGDASHSYKVGISYRLRQAPVVHVLKPELCRRASGEDVPHCYRDGSLCLYYPRNREWTPRAAIAETIVPWTCEWLHFYELWHATGEWLGGGIHGTPGKRRSRVVDPDL